MDHEVRKHFVFSLLYFLLFQFLNRKSMFAVLHSDTSSLKSGLLHLTGQHYCKRGRSAKLKYRIINQILWNYLVDRYNCVGQNWVNNLSAKCLSTKCFSTKRCGACQRSPVVYFSSSQSIKAQDSVFSQMVLVKRRHDIQNNNIQ